MRYARAMALGGTRFTIHLVPLNMCKHLVTCLVPRERRTRRTHPADAGWPRVHSGHGSVACYAAFWKLTSEQDWDLTFADWYRGRMRSRYGSEATTGGDAM